MALHKPNGKNAKECFVAATESVSRSNEFAITKITAAMDQTRRTAVSLEHFECTLSDAL